MNFVTTHNHTKRRFIGWAIAVGLAWMLTIGQPTVGQWFGIDTDSVAFACQTQQGSGDC